MALVRRLFVMLWAALIAGNILAVNVLAAGKALSDRDNLLQYSHWDYFGGPLVGYLVFVLFNAAENIALCFIPWIVIVVLFESLKIRSIWVYIGLGALGAMLFDVTCVTYPGLVGMRSFCNTYSLSELAIVTAAGGIAGYVFWRLAGHDAGAWRSPSQANASPANTSVSV